MKFKLLLCLALFAFSVSASARAVRTWSDAELMKSSDLVVLAQPISSKDLDETNSLGWPSAEPWERFRGVETTFKVLDALKGLPKNDRIVLHHYRFESGAPPNGPTLISFMPGDTNKYILYLAKDGPNRYAPATGQLDPDISIKSLNSMAGQPDVTNDNTLQWGEIVGGFEMATALDETNGIIHCYIRNATTNEIDYPSFDFGYFEYIHLEIRGATNWIRVGKYGLPLFPRSFGYSSACPYFVKRIPPGRVVTNTYTGSRFHPWPEHTFEDYLKQAKGNTNEALLTQKLNQWYISRETLEAAACSNYTFAIDLFESDEMASLPQGDSLEARVSQSFLTNRAAQRMVTLYSPSFMLSSSLLQSCAKENYPLIIHRAANKPLTNP